MPGLEPGPNPAPLATRAWNMMGGSIDWAALPVVIEMLGITDAERLLVELFAIRDFQADRQ